jgi:hypothetical protein
MEQEIYDFLKKVSHPLAKKAKGKYNLKLSSVNCSVGFLSVYQFSGPAVVKFVLFV